MHPRRKKQIRLLAPIVQLRKELSLLALQRATLRCKALQQTLASLEASQTLANDDISLQNRMLASLAYESWAQPQRIALNERLAREISDIDKLSDEARRRLGEAHAFEVRSLGL